MYVPEPVDSVPLRIQVYERLEKLIVEGRYRPGDRLPENELASLLSVSRGPIREALQLLERDGWVEVKPRHGATVRRRTLTEVAEFFDMRRVLEVHAAVLCARNLTDAKAERLQELMRLSHEADISGDPAALMKANWEVHCTIPKLSGNQAMAETILSLGRRVRWYTLTPRSWERAKDVLAEHGALVDAICERDEAKASRLMDTHIANNWAAYQRWISENTGQVVSDLAPIY
ncbi:MAG TPA: GntR family transcriptional regulator [Xanthobacteraceae bacterium]|nr:GntR family transcriptional regulator [Xanthobacteraceae bacterium]